MNVQCFWVGLYNSYVGVYSLISLNLEDFAKTVSNQIGKWVAQMDIRWLSGSCWHWQWVGEREIPQLGIISLNTKFHKPLTHILVLNFHKVVDVYSVLKT